MIQDFSTSTRQHSRDRITLVLHVVVRQSLVILEWLLRKSAVSRTGSATMFVIKEVTL